MRVEALENSSKQVPDLVSLCREGQITDNGYTLWVNVGIVRKEGGSLEAFGTSPEEIRGFLVQDLRGWLGAITDGVRETDSAYRDLEIIGAYFLPRDDEPPLEEGVFDQLGISVDEFHGLVHHLDVRSAREELDRCRTEGVTPKFYGLKTNLLTGKTTLGEIGGTPEEINAFTNTYNEQHPDTNWDKISQPQENGNPNDILQ